MIDIFKEFIEKNPSKVLGEKKATTDRFGNPDIKIVGNIEELMKIDVSESNIPNKNKETSDVTTNNGDLDTRLENIKKSLDKSPKINSLINEKQAKSTKKRKTRKKQYILEGDSEQELFTGDEAFKILNKQSFDEDFLSVWYWYHKSNNKPINDYFRKFEKPYTSGWVSHNLDNGNLCYDFQTKSLVPSALYYSGNIYDKIVAITSPQGSSEYEKYRDIQLKKLKNIVPTQLKLTGEKDERLVIDVLSKFANDTTIDYNGEEETIVRAFKSYLRSLDRESVKHNISIYKVINYLEEEDRFPKKTHAYEKAEIKRQA